MTRSFKSIRSLELESGRMNTFIGEPNTKNSNVLEAIEFLWYLGHGGSPQDFIRFETLPSISFNMALENEISR